MSPVLIPPPQLSSWHRAEAEDGLLPRRECRREAPAVGGVGCGPSELSLSVPPSVLRISLMLPCCLPGPRSPKPLTHCLFKLVIFCLVCSLRPGGPADSFINNRQGRRLSVQQGPRAHHHGPIIPTLATSPLLPPTARGAAQLRVKGLNLH